MKDNPEPTKNNLPAVWDLVIQDMRERDKIGVERYHTRLQPFNGRDALLDAKEEILDFMVYMYQEMYEREELLGCLKRACVLLAEKEFLGKEDIAEIVSFLQSISERKPVDLVV